MKKISIDRVKPGMKIVKEVMNEAGMVVVPAGKELTESLINKLTMMDIQHVYVEGERDLPPKDDVLREIEIRFKRIDDPITLNIKRALLTHIEELYK
ncbi:hypothetical protein [Thermodesulfovibrio sp.]|uniref:hypothetical protein n=1 Tax=Thermodesulfovibrio sp. TaxID=2067987 RepID=UPI0030A66E61